MKYDLTHEAKFLIEEAKRIGVLEAGGSEFLPDAIDDWLKRYGVFADKLRELSSLIDTLNETGREYALLK